MVVGSAPDFFVSYNSADEAWAEWIGWRLEDAGFTAVLQAWDFRPGSNFVLEMDRAAKTADRTIAVLSPDYLDASFPQPEWSSAVATDPEGVRRTLVPVRVRECQPTGLLGQIVYIDLVGLGEDAAHEALIAGLRERGKPEQPPAFPGGASHPQSKEPTFPGRDAVPSVEGQRENDLEGLWVKVDGMVFEAESVEDSGTTITISGRFDRQTARRLERLRQTDFGGARVRVVHGDRVVNADVRRLRRSDRAGHSDIALELDRVEAVSATAMRAGTGGMSPDDLVEAGVRHILLGDPLPGSLGTLRFMADPGIDRASLVRALSGSLTEARHVGRLVLAEGLISNGHAAAVTRFDVADLPDGTRYVDVEWEERRVYTNVEPGHRRVEGALDLSGPFGFESIR
jgi:hypothetical protein